MRIYITFLLLLFFRNIFSQDSCFQKQVYDPAVDADNFKIIPKRMDDFIKTFKGCQVPYFEGQTMTGEKISSNNLIGKVVVLNFWFTRCKPCLGEFPALNLLAKKFSKKDVVFISFVLDSAKTVDAFLIRHPLLYQVIPAVNEIAKDFKIVAYPTNIVLDKNLRIAEIIHGGCVDPKFSLDNYKKLFPVISRELKRRL